MTLDLEKKRKKENQTTRDTKNRNDVGLLGRDRNNRGMRVCAVESQYETRWKEEGGRKWKNTKQQA